MRRTARTLLPALGLLSLSAAATAAHAQYMVYGITAGPGGAQQLVRFNSANPTAVTTIGLTGANLTGLDFRPATGTLFGFNGSQLFTVDVNTGAASAASTVAPTTGGNVGFDFNPTVDRIRIVDFTAGTNLRVNPDNGVPVVDGPYTYASGDASTGAPAFSGVAYTNSDTDPATGTTLFGIDGTRGTLVRITSPNGGAVNTVGSLGLNFAPTVTGFDIVTVGSSNFAFFSALTTGAVSNFYSLNLDTGAATFVGAVGGASGVGLQGLAIAAVPEPGTWALLATGLAGLAGVARRRTRRAEA
jgi:hypothetical protein